MNSATGAPNTGSKSIGPRLIGISPKDTFSGFQNTFFDAVEAQGASIIRIGVQLRLFRLKCLIMGFHPKKSEWGPRFSHLYHMSVMAFKMKSHFVQQRIRERLGEVDAIYQVGSLWDPVPPGTDKPFFIHVSYTTRMSVAKGGWRISSGKEQEFRLARERELFEKARVVFTTTQNTRSSVIGEYGIPPDKVVAVNAGVSPPYDNLNPDRHPDYSSRKILFVGKGDYGKGLDTVLEAFKITRHAIPDAGLTIVGPNEFTAALEGITFLGRIGDRNKVKELYYQHALFAMPSRFEPFGQVFIEAMSCHLPCIGTTRDAMPEIIDHEKTGYLIEAGDHERLAEYFIRLLGDPEHARKMGQAAYGKLTSTYTWPIVGERIVNTMREALAAY